MSDVSTVIGRFRETAAENAADREDAARTLMQLKNHGITVSQILIREKDLSPEQTSSLRTILGCISVQAQSIESAIVLNDVQTIATNDVLSNAQKLVAEIDELFAEQE